ncbi:MAG: class II fructose-bisphosphate aldolase [Alphaproteobacteria bacterium]|nr:class II fructose-bisphosphate aldolase [Alphaproteobacteria bacterium]
MTRAALAEVLRPALTEGYAVPGLVCLGWEDARAYVAAAEAERAPVILQAGPGCRAHTPLPVLAAMLGHLADEASVPVVIHLDHGYAIEECRQAIECGFTSVMFDGSRKPLEQNIEETAAIAALAHEAGVSCEGEIGFVGYADGEHSAGTDPEEAARFASETGIDAMAVSIGNVHLQQDHSSNLDEARLAAIEAVTDLPLVIHGGSGVPTDQRRRLAANSAICKFNIGTELRQVFGQAVRAALDTNPGSFDRILILKSTEPDIERATRALIQGLGASARSPS